MDKDIATKGVTGCWPYAATLVLLIGLALGTLMLLGQARTAPPFSGVPAHYSQGAFSLVTGATSP